MILKELFVLLMLDLVWLNLMEKLLHVILKLEETKTFKEYIIPTLKFIVLKNVHLNQNSMFLELLNSQMNLLFVELLFILEPLKMIKEENCIFQFQMMLLNMIKKIKILFKLKN